MICSDGVLVCVCFVFLKILVEEKEKRSNKLDLFPVIKKWGGVVSVVVVLWQSYMWHWHVTSFAANESSPPAPSVSPFPRPVATRAPGPGRAVFSAPRPHRQGSALFASPVMRDRDSRCVDWRRLGVAGVV